MALLTIEKPTLVSIDDKYLQVLLSGALLKLDEDQYLLPDGQIGRVLDINGLELFIQRKPNGKLKVKNVSNTLQKCIAWAH